MLCRRACQGVATGGRVRNKTAELVGQRARVNLGKQFSAQLTSVLLVPQLGGAWYTPPCMAVISAIRGSFLTLATCSFVLSICGPICQIRGTLTRETSPFHDSHLLRKLRLVGLSFEAGQHPFCQVSQLSLDGLGPFFQLKGEPLHGRGQMASRERAA